MPGPFYNAIKGTTAGTPGTGAFTPNAASSGFRAWSNVPTGWVGLARYEDGTDWELQYSYWNGTTLSRSASAQFVASSTGSGLTLTSAATAAMVSDANEIAPDFAGYPVRGHLPLIGGTTLTILGSPNATVQGTAAAAAIASTNYLTRQIAVKYTSATTASALAGLTTTGSWVMSSSTSGTGGWLYNARFGCLSLPTGPCIFVGMTSSSYSTGEPSAKTAHLAALGLDSTDTNLQIITNSNAGACTKINTGIPLVAAACYDLTLWSDPGSLTIFYLLIRLDNGAIFYGSTATDVPTADQAMFPNVLGALNATNTGTAIVVHICHSLIRSVS